MDNTRAKSAVSVIWAIVDRFRGQCQGDTCGTSPVPGRAFCDACGVRCPACGREHHADMGCEGCDDDSRRCSSCGSEAEHGRCTVGECRSLSVAAARVTYRNRGER